MTRCAAIAHCRPSESSAACALLRRSLRYDCRCRSSYRALSRHDLAVLPRVTPFHTANERIRCELSVGAHGTGVDCSNARRGASLNWSGGGYLWPVRVPASARSRNVRAGTRLAIHVPTRTGWCISAAPTAPPCAAHTPRHTGFPGRPLRRTAGVIHTSEWPSFAGHRNQELRVVEVI
jgi:hypothetical protein